MPVPGSHDCHVFFGCSVTVTSHNLDVVVSDRFVREMTGTGARTFVYSNMSRSNRELTISSFPRSGKKTSMRQLPGSIQPYPALCFGSSR
jgi:hypothetical protein